MRPISGWTRLVALSMSAMFFVTLPGCGDPNGEDDLLEEPEAQADGDFWAWGDAEEPPEIGKADAILGQRALPKTADTSSTAAWEVQRNWSDKVNVDFAPYFKKADGITWNDAYRKFVEGLEATSGVNGYKTYKLTTPWGKTLPVAALECAEQAMFMRLTFSAWFNLPFFMEAIDGTGTRVFAGHFGFRTLQGRYKNFNEFKTLYKDYSATAKASAWPQDKGLRAKKLGGDDEQSAIMGLPGATFGTYLDEIHANKRAGHFTMLLLVWFGSVNLADPANTFHLKPEAIRPGDVLLERWQRAGIGHTLNVKKVEKLSNGKLSAELASGSMPRRQSLWEGPITSRRYFTNDLMGGEGTASDGTPYAKLGGGLRRWRVPVVYNGGWVNTVPGDSSSAWINSTDLAAIAARPAQFEQLLDVPDPRARKAALVDAVKAARQYQREHPASCSNREKRDRLLLELSEAMDDMGQGYYAFMREAASYEDYVFPELTYDKSKTCCWNTTTAAMGSLVLDYNRARDRQTQSCQKPVPFVASNYPVFKAYAEQVGKGAQWKAWSEDEPCPQKTNADDTLSPAAQEQVGGYCGVKSYLPDAR